MFLLIVLFFVVSTFKYSHAKIILFVPSCQETPQKTPIFACQNRKQAE